MLNLFYNGIWRCFLQAQADKKKYIRVLASWAYINVVNYVMKPVWVGILKLLSFQHWDRTPKETFWDPIAISSLKNQILFLLKKRVVEGIQLTTLSIFCIISPWEMYWILRYDFSIRLFCLLSKTSVSILVVLGKFSLGIFYDLGVVCHLCIIKRL